MPYPFRPELLPSVVRRLRALADENRIRLLLTLREKPSSVNALASILQIAQPSVSKHLAILKHAGLVQCEKDGTQCIYAIRDESIFDICSVVCDGVVRHLQAEHAALNLPPIARKKSRKQVEARDGRSIRHLPSLK